MTETNLKDCMFPVDPTARAMKLFSVPRGMQFVISIDGTKDRIEIVNPTDGRRPFFRLHEETRVSEAIELRRESERDYVDLS